MPPRVDGAHGAVPDVHRGQVLGAGHMQIAQAALGAGQGLVRVRDRRRSDQLLDPGQEAGLQQPGCLGAQGGHPAGGHVRASKAASTEAARRTGR